MADLEFSAGGVIFKWAKKRPKALLIKDSYGRWTWPKGKLKKGEGSEDAAIREIGEEVGLRNLLSIGRIGKTHYFYRLKGKLIFKTVYFYLFRHIGRETLKVRYSEIEDAAWFMYEEALKMLEYKGAKSLLKKAYKKFQTSYGY